jgi:hypothetical protein
VDPSRDSVGLALAGTDAPAPGLAPKLRISSIDRPLIAPAMH